MKLADRLIDWLAPRSTRWVSQEPPPALASPTEMKARGVDLVVYEPVDEPNQFGAIKPYCIEINGVEILTPDEKPVVIEGLVDKSTCTTATVTMFVRSLDVRGHKPRTNAAS